MRNAIISSMKTCFKCEKTLPRTEFYKHPAMGDGLLGKCKECAKSDVRARRLVNIEHVREYDRNRAKLPERIRLSAEINNRWRREDRRRTYAHNKVAKAIRVGSITREPCSVCGNKKSMAHHENYDKPLEVVWYCQVHHKARHKEMAILGIEP